MLQTKSGELRGILGAYLAVCKDSWPDLHQDLEATAASWQNASMLQLQRSLDRLLSEAAAPPREVRVFWKFGDELLYGGCNHPFAHDAGFAEPEQLVGRTDFDEAIPWTRQAAKYQSDDREVIAGQDAKLFILERQEREDGVFWLHTGKAPIFDAEGDACGILGMYETIDGRQVNELMRRKEELTAA